MEKEKNGHCSMAPSSSLKLTSSEAAAISSCTEMSAERKAKEKTDKSGLVVLEVFEPLVESLCWRQGEDADGRDEKRKGPSGVCNMPEPLRSSLVGLAPRGCAGRGDGVGIGGAVVWHSPEILIPVTCHTCTTITFSTTSNGMFFSFSFVHLTGHPTSLFDAADTTQALLNDIRTFGHLHTYPKDSLNVLRLDLTLGSSSAVALVHQLEKSSIERLFTDRISAAIAHIHNLRLRVQDPSSKVLVTGDLNAGKSSFVNALLRRNAMPVDQQPCTTAFCQVHDAAENQGLEEVHILNPALHYDPLDPSSHSKGSLAQLEHIVADNDSTDQIIKVYLNDTRPPDQSLLNNGLVNISLIDAPGLNRDSLHTTALFARQQEIDVVVFVVSAENHFTLSAQQFLSNASNEKAYLFIVVNKFDQIKNKDKCRRLVLDQIKLLSPHTFQDANDLVHFVDSAAALQSFTPAFELLESALRSFVLVKRSKSKLLPVATYLRNILSDVDLLASANAVFASAQLESARTELSHSRPILEKLDASYDALETSLDSTEEDHSSLASSNTKSILVDALDRVSQGHLGVSNPPIPLPSYPGILGIWDYARDVRKALLASIDTAVKLAEEDARVSTKTGVDKVQAFGEEYLPEGVERSRKVFVPEAMFSSDRRANKASKRRKIVVAGATHGLGIGLASRPEFLETTVFDLFDVKYQFMLYFSNAKHSSSSLVTYGSDEVDIDDDQGPSPTALSVLSLGLGALTMVGGQAIGARGVIEGILRLGDLFSNESSKNWIAPVLGVTTIGLGAYLVFELPSTIPRTIGRRVRSQVVRAHRQQLLASSPVYVPRSGASSYIPGFVDGHAERVGKETRKVLRLACWDLRERFRVALQERQRQVKKSEEMERRAEEAMRWFESVGERAEVIRKEIKVEELESM